MQEASPLQIFNMSGKPLPVDTKNFHQLMAEIEKGEGVVFDLLEVVFVSEEEIVELNKTHLNRDYVTDIISFSYSEDPGAEPESSEGPEGSDKNSSFRHLEGTLYCCAPRIIEQAGELGVPVDEEFCRIVAHGMLHLAGYDDQSDDQRSKMRQMENHYLSSLDH